MNTCREELLTIIKDFVKNKGENKIYLSEIIKLAKEKKINYSESTIKTHISSKMCKNSPQHHQTKYNDLERISRGLYRLINS